MVGAVAVEQRDVAVRGDGRGGGGDGGGGAGGKVGGGGGGGAGGVMTTGDTATKLAASAPVVAARLSGK